MFDGLIYYFKTCFKINKKYLILLFLSQIIKVFNRLIVLILPKNILDSIFVSNNFQEAIYYLILLFLSNFIINFSLNFIETKIIVQRMLTFKEFQLMVGSKMMNAPMDYLESATFLDLKNKGEQFIYSGGNGFGYLVESAFELIGKCVSLLTYIGIMATLTPILVIAMLILVLMDTYINLRFLRKNIQLNLEKSMYERKSYYFSNLFQDFNYGKDIRVFGISNWLLKKYEKQLDKMQDFYKNSGNNNLKAKNISTLISLLQSLISYFYLILKASEKAITVGDFSLYLSTISSFNSTLSSILLGIVTLKEQTSYYENFKKYMNVPNVFEKKSNIIDNKNEFEIEFKNVSYQYKGQSSFALKNVSVIISSKDKISIVGKNGSGKSTFIKLILRIYVPTEGEILYNGTNINDINYESYLSLFGTVFQDPKLLSLSVAENIVLCDNWDSKKVAHILNEVDMKNKILSLPLKLDNMLYKDFDENGYTPSGGETQRLCISRALYKNPPILILDEATSALDASAEHSFNKMLLTLFNNKTCLFITHRLSFSKICDKILVFKEGRLVEEGSHDYLTKKSCEYSDLYNMQSSPYK